MDQLVCFWGASASVYKGAKGEGGAGQEEGAGGVLLLPGVGLPPFPSWNRIRGEGKRGERGGRGAGPLSLSYSDQGGEGRAAHLWPPLLSSTKAH